MSYLLELSLAPRLGLTTKKEKIYFFVSFFKNYIALEKCWWSNFGNLMKIEPTVNILKIHPGVLCL